MNLTPQQLEDATFLRETMRWPHWPLCSLIREVDGKREYATCYDGPKQTLEVRNVVVFSLTMEGAKWDDAPIIKTYANGAELVLDGWRVD